MTKKDFSRRIEMGERFFDPRALAICTILLLSNVAYSETATPQEALLLRRITEYWKDGDYATVKRQVIDFLTKNPNTSLRDPLNSMLGDLYFQEHNFQQALATYLSIENPEIREKIYFNHLQAHFEMRDYLPVIEKGEDFLKDKNKSAAIDPLKVRYLVAESYFRYALSCDDMEKKVFYLKLAKPHYKLLSQSTFSDRALFPLAEVHRLLREDERAAAIYISLAEKFPEHQERFLFQAAILQIKDNKFEAINNFFKVHELKGKRSRLAAYNALILMYQAEQYEDYLRLYNETVSLMPNQKIPLLTFYEGRSHYALGKYDQAVLSLENFIKINKEKSKELKTAFLLLANCSRYLKDVPLLERTYYSFQTIFPKDSEAAKVLMIHAQMNRDSGNIEQALTDLKTLIATYPDESEGALYDCAVLLAQTDQWKGAREMFSQFIEQYPSSQRATAAWRHLLNCSIEELKNGGEKQSFVSIVEGALKHNALSQKEKEQYELAMLKCQCELGQFEIAAPMIAGYISSVADRSLLADAHLLMAICQKKLSTDAGLFIHHGEMALKHNPKLPESGLLHLELFNVYLAKGETEVTEKDYFYGRSAEHLFASGAWKDKTIKFENYVWLTNYYYNQALAGRDYDKAKLLYCNLLDTVTPQLEVEALKFAHLLGLHDEKRDQIALLQQLSHAQATQSELPWKLKRRTTLELAQAYESDGEYAQAIKLYCELAKPGERSTSIVTNTAQLHLAKLKYRQINPVNRTAENPEIITILHDLKDLQIQKKLLAEPLHLEAALQYAEIRCNMTAGEEQAKNSHFFYKRMVEDFNNLEDPITQEYTILRQQHPEKNGIFNAYMQYAQAQMLKCEAEILKAKNRTSKAAECQQKALETVNLLLQNKEHLQPYLLDRVKKIKVELVKE
ncbi:MAG: tetratricopeptide repeat protein [Verrucomicrobia bacterium]|nr:tetratricopeptide repeat protein [Verrucomicrobiota bacterium]